MNGRIKTKTALILALPLVMIGTALGGEGLQVKITNDGTQDSAVMTPRACATIPPSMCTRTPAAASSRQGRASESTARCDCRA